MVGDVKSSTQLLETLLKWYNSYILCYNARWKGQLLNTVCRYAASAGRLAIAFEVFDVTLNYCFRKNPGVLFDAEDDSSVIENINQKNYIQIKSRKQSTFGMIPKLDNCFNSTYLEEFKIKNWSSPHVYKTKPHCTH
jgi:acetylglutamate kinase